MPNDITVTKNTTVGSERWDVEYTADQAATVTKTMTTAGTMMDRNVKVSVTTPAGTEGTPTATKGAVSGNAISVTPSVTNSAGYISGGTKTGTAVSVTASELVSGTKPISSSGTTDVTNYASASVAAGSATTPTTTITANPSISVNSSTGVITATASASQSVTPTVSAGYVSSGTAGTITVSGSNTSSLSTVNGTTVSPTESEQTAVAANKYTLGAVKVGAISSTYVGSGITQRTSSDLSASGATVTAPAGYYPNAAAKTVTSGSATTPATTITPNAISISVDSSGLITASNTQKTQSVTPTVSAGYVSSGTAGTITVSAASNTSQLTTQAAQTITPTTSDQTIAAGKFLTGAQTIKGDANLVAANIAKDVSIFGVIGMHEGGSGWAKLYEWDLTLSTTSTSEYTAATYTVSIPFDTAEYQNAWYFVQVRDKSGVRTGRYIGTDTLLVPNTWFIAGENSGDLTAHVTSYCKRSDGTLWYYKATGRTSMYGVFPAFDQISTTSFKLYGRYNVNHTCTINSIYRITLYKSPLPPYGNPFNYSFS